MRSLAVAITLLLAWSPASFAASWYIEGPEAEAKGDANADVAEMTKQGLDARVVRRMGVNTGWRYVVRIEGFDSEATARGAASKLAEAADGQVVIYRVDADRATLVDTVGEGAAPPPAVPQGDAAPALEKAVAAHKVGGLVLDGRDLQFTFQRTLVDGRVADHVWARRGESIYVSVEAVSGDVVESRLKVIGDAAWLSVAGGPFESQNLDKTKQTALDLGPTSVLPFLLVLDPARQTRRELQRMQFVGAETVDGVKVDVLAFEGDQAAGPVRVEIGQTDHLVRRVAFDNGELVYEFGDYGKVGDLYLPRDVTTRRGGEVVDRVRISDLNLSPKLPEAWFQAP